MEKKIKVENQNNFVIPLVKNVRTTVVALKSANLRHVLPFFSALRHVAPFFQR
jgi:hypothetical protein